MLPIIQKNFLSYLQCIKFYKDLITRITILILDRVTILENGEGSLANIRSFRSFQPFCYLSYC